MTSFSDGEKLAKFGISGKMFNEICTFDEPKMAFLAAKSFGA